MFGKPRVLDISQTLDRNGMPFLVVHVGVRSTFLKNSYEPWLRDAVWFALMAALAAMLAAGLLANVALRPMEAISEQLESLTRQAVSWRATLRRSCRSAIGERYRGTGDEDDRPAGRADAHAGGRVSRCRRI